MEVNIKREDTPLESFSPQPTQHREFIGEKSTMGVYNSKKLTTDPSVRPPERDKGM